MKWRIISLLLLHQLTMNHLQQVIQWIHKEPHVREVVSAPFEDFIVFTKKVFSSDVLGRVEAEQNRWMKKVEEQRRNIFEDHTMLN